MGVLKATKYDKGVILACGAEGRCPLESDCEYWDIEKKVCSWPEEETDFDDFENENIFGD